MSSLKAAKSQIARQQTQEIRALTVAADQAEKAGNREACIELVTHIYQLLDSAYSNTADRGEDPMVMPLHLTH